MSPDQIQHREQIILDYSNSYRAIYDAGAKEHKTVMSTLPVYMMAQEAMNEAQDSYAYNHVVKSQLDKVRIRLQQLKDIFQEQIDQGIQDNTTVWLLEELYDPIRRIEAIERILYGEG